MSNFWRLNLRSQRLAQDEGGHAIWQVQTSAQEWAADQTALLLCDVWNGHWCRGAVERLDAMVKRMDTVVQAVRAAGGLIVHAPSDTMDFYADAPARQRALAAPQVVPPPDAERPDPPLPVDASDHGADTGETETYKAWNRQHPGIGIDQERDIISDKGTEVYSYLQHQGIAHLLIMGVHTNMCVLHHLCHQADGALGDGCGADPRLDRRDVQSSYAALRQPRRGYGLGDRVYRKILVSECGKQGCNRGVKLRPRD